MKNLDFTFRTPWILEIGGGVFFAFLLRWTETLFLIRSLLLPISSWTGLSGAEYIALILGRYSLLGGAVFISTTAITGGVNLVQLGLTIFALGIWEFGKRSGKSSNPEIWAWGVLVGAGFLSLGII